MSHPNSDFNLNNFATMEMNEDDEYFMSIASSLVQQLADPNTAAVVYQPEFRRAVLAAVQQYFEQTSQGIRPTAWMNTLIRQLDLHNRIDFRRGPEVLFAGLWAWNMFQYLPEQEYLVPRNALGKPVVGQITGTPTWQQSPPGSVYPDPELYSSEGPQQSRLNPLASPATNSPVLPSSSLRPTSSNYHREMAAPRSSYNLRSTGASSSSSANAQTAPTMGPPAIDPALTTPAIISTADSTTTAAAPAAPATTTTTTTTNTNTATNPGNNPIPYTTMTPTTALATANAPTFNANSVRANSIIPLDLEEEVLIKDDDEWGFRCDMCGYVRRQRGEFNRHIRDGSGGARPGFKLVAANSNHSSGFWYGRDNNGREYAGTITLYNPPYWTAPPCRENLHRQARPRPSRRR